MAKISFWSPESHEQSAKAFCKAIGCTLELGDVTEYPDTNRQPYRSYKMFLTSEQSKLVRDEFHDIIPSKNLSTIIKGVVDGYKVMIDKESDKEPTPTGGVIKAGWILRKLLSEKK